MINETSMGHGYSALTAVLEAVELSTMQKFDIELASNGFHSIE